MAAAKETVTQNRVSETEALRAVPVLRTETHFVATGLPTEFLQKGKLFTVVSRAGRRRISEDDPSIYSSHLLGSEGDFGETVTLEVRGGESEQVSTTPQIDQE